MMFLKRLAGLAVLVCVIGMAIACGSTPDYFSDEGGSITVYFPFVEEVILPDAIIAGEPALVTIRLSSDAYPGALNGRLPDDLELGFRSKSGQDVSGFLYLAGVPSWNGQALTEYQIGIQYATPGERTLTLWTVPSRELGGTEGKIYPHDESQDVPVTDTQLVSRRFNLTVLPAE